VRIDRAGVPFILAAALPALLLWGLGVGALALVLLALPLGIALFFRDPDRVSPLDVDAVLSPADGRVMFAGDAKPDEAPPGAWRQVTIFLSPLDVHINRTPVSGTVRRVEYVPGTFFAAYRPEAGRNEHSEIWLEHDGETIVARQVVGLMARRVVCRVKAGDRVAAGARLGLMKFGSRMDVFVPMSASLATRQGTTVRGGETVIARLAAR
jgi:phosphatidylserine decarboxylase